MFRTVNNPIYNQHGDIVSTVEYVEPFTDAISYTGLKKKVKSTEIISVNITAGGLYASFNSFVLKTITALKITGTLDARDFKTMRDSMTVLSDVDFSEASIIQYYGNKGTNDTITTLYPANEIPAYAFGSKSYTNGNNKLQSLEMSSSTLSIGNYAFQYCSALSSMIIASSVVSIGNSAFYSCTGFTSFYIPVAVTHIGNSAFLGINCTIHVDPGNSAFSDINGILFNKDQSTLIKYPSYYGSSYTIPTTVDSISNLAFFGCNSLNDVTIPTTVTYLGNQAFSYCRGLTSMFVPASVISMGSYVFLASSCLITVDNNNPNFSSGDGLLFDKLKTKLIQCPTSKTGIYDIPASVTSLGYLAFQNCTSLTSVTIPSSITNIPSSTFNSCTGLTLMTIPASITAIGTSAFYNCSGLSTLYALPITPIVLSSTSNVFYNVNKTSCTLYVPVGSKANYQSATLWKDFQNIVEVSTTPGQISKTVNVISAGTLASLLSAGDRITLTNLTVTGSIDASDFRTMRDLIPNLTDLDLTDATIVAYSGTKGTDPTLGTANGTYLANAIPQHAFDIGSPYVGNRNLKYVKLPLSTTSIGSYAFVSCYALKNISVPTTISSIGSSAFSSCRALDSFKIPDSMTTISDQSFCGTGLRSVIIPQNITSLGYQAFSICDSLTTVSIPNSVVSIPSMCFSFCPNLASVYVYNSTPLSLTYSPFDKSDIANCTLYVPYKAKLKYAADKVWNQFSTIIEDNSGFNLSSNSVSISSESGSKATVSILSNVNWTVSVDQSWLNVSPTTGSNDNNIIITADANIMFPTRSAIVTISVKDKASQTIIVTQDGCLKTINNIAGSLKSTLTKIEKATITSLRITGTIDARDFKMLRDSMPNLQLLDLKEANILAYSGFDGTSTDYSYYENKIPRNSFYNSNTGLAIAKLKTVILPANTKSIGQSAFFSNTTLQSVEFPDTLTSIEAQAFSNCTSLNKIELPNSIVNLDVEAFLNCKQIAEVLIPNSVTSIGDRAFSNCSSLTHVTLPNSIKLTPRSCFENCSSLNNIVIPNSITYINMSTFAYCSSLTSIIIPNSVTWIDARAFEHCYSLKKIDIPNSVTRLGAYAFYFCDSIESVTIPKSVTSIDNGIFELCRGLKSIYNYGTTPLIIYPSSPVFNYVSKTDCILYVPNGTKSAYQAAFEWKDFQNIVEMTTAVSELLDAKVSLYPNPVTTSFQINGIEGTYTVILSDLNGKNLFTKQVIGNENISVTNLPKGMYIAKIITKEGTIEKKIVKE